MRSSAAGLSLDCVIKYLRVLVLMSTVMLLFMALVVFALLSSTSDLTVLTTLEIICLVFLTVIGFFGALYRNRLAVLVFAGMCGLNFIGLVISLVSSTTVKTGDEATSTTVLESVSHKLTWLLAWTQFVQSAVGAFIWTFQPNTPSNTEIRT